MSATMAIGQWLSEVYRRIAARAKRHKAWIYWGDETGRRSDDVRGRSFAPAGQPAVVRVAGKRFGCNVISALTNKGQMSFMVPLDRFIALQEDQTAGLSAGWYQADPSPAWDNNRSNELGNRPAAHSVQRRLSDCS